MRLSLLIVAAFVLPTSASLAASPTPSVSLRRCEGSKVMTRVSSPLAAAASPMAAARHAVDEPALPVLATATASAPVSTARSSATALARSLI